MSGEIIAGEIVEPDQIDYLIQIRGVYDGWSVAVLKDGTRVNRWAGIPGYEWRASATDEYLREAEPK